MNWKPSKYTQKHQKNGQNVKNLEIQTKYIENGSKSPRYRASYRGQDFTRAVHAVSRGVAFLRFDVVGADRPRLFSEVW